jgi:hypothetical protein
MKNEQTGWMYRWIVHWIDHWIDTLKYSIQVLQLCNGYNHTRVNNSQAIGNKSKYNRCTDNHNFSLREFQVNNNNINNILI